MQKTSFKKRVLLVLFIFFCNLLISCTKNVKKESTDESIVEPPTHAFLDINVYLQAAISGTNTEMSTGLTGVIPTNDPYGVGVTCPDINTIPDVVDWIKV